ncbi:hypothetical protein ASPACDRAFT_1888127 [Aspergillus aculeatus ATCC 16872]|uniref:Uncharacterized protein n=1 Tax=Aspergillus aculeatus (strain ATCC 16872 / CBS 172.66 / WB 5094) TaxID=690307 RepID=A0A1L9WW69_ASPA1|nr:uncharacterized protein ASPACDRAFT_1888127 [Aspergillus aculeatus ATCC 16872]OJK00430.1 hypothetical protein ASPACDRAFT_1888127 [Aspergillus aculeatus ATCC 16872]
MRNSRKHSYFILGNTDHAPDGSICLGQIITDLRKPYCPLAPARLPLPKTHCALQTDYTCSQSSTKSRSGGVTSAFLAQLGSPLSADVSICSGRVETEEWHFDRLETRFIEPEREYVLGSVLAADPNPVREYLERGRYLGKSVYMITGIKVGMGLRFQRSSGRERAVDASVLVDASALAGIPVQAGPTGGFKRHGEVRESFQVRDEFVFAYRVRKVFVSWRDPKRVGSQEVYGGELMGTGDDDESDDDVEDSEEEEQPGEIDTVTLEGWDVGSLYVPKGFEEVTVQEEGSGEECQVLKWSD